MHEILKENMGLEFARIINEHYYSDKQQDLYESIMKVAESFVDLALVSSAPPASIPHVSCGTVEFTIPLDDEEWMEEHLKRCCGSVPIDPEKLELKEGKNNEY